MFNHLKMSFFKRIEDYSYYAEIDFEQYCKVDLQLGWAYLSCSCGTEVTYAKSTGIQFVGNRTACYAMCDECKNKMTEEELNKNIALAIYKTGKAYNYIPAPITHIFGNNEFTIPRTDGSTSIATVSTITLKNRIKLSKHFNGYVLYVSWIDKKNELVGKDVLIDKILELNFDNPLIIDAIQKLKKYYPSS